MIVNNLTSSRGNVIPNQFEIRTANAVYFQSYRSIIAKIERGITYLDETYWDYSKTTGKYRNIFLGENKKETQKKIESGEYVLANLNSEPIKEPIDTNNFKFLKNK